MSASNSNDDELRWRDRVVGDAQTPLPEPWFIRDVRKPADETPPPLRMRPADQDDSDILPDLPPWQARPDDRVRDMPPPGPRRAPRAGVPPWLYALGAAIVAIVALALWLTAAPKEDGAPPVTADDQSAATEAQAEPSASMLPPPVVDCAGPDTIAQLRGLVVGMARQAGGNGDNGLARRAASLSVSVAASPDVATGDGRGVACRGSASYQPFLDEAATTATLAYRVRPAAGGRVSISNLEGVGPIVAALARNEPVVAAAPAAADVADDAVEEPVARQPAPAPIPRAAPVRIPAAAPTPIPTPTPIRERAPPVRERPPVVAAAPPARELRFANPSFDCRRVTSQVLRTVCASETLSALDRDMSDLFFSLRNNAEPEIRDDLEAGRDEFIDRRQRCDSEACIARAYRDRIAELEVYR